MTKAYDKRAAQRRAENERRLLGESLATYHARENAPPPTLAQVYADNHKNRVRCPDTPDLLAWKPKKKRPAPPQAPAAL